eukprot:CAMPEP_0116115220 /NCGR_PEP_ID=MMETSP0329-20121206/389_1 /TAXON_ID=697910 /ORGANISM="Pseudo-nitzschia arenysensis, Strain B593" /LENGTH=350 /DNA_ID=CAMNT_0003608635 /DNA_START=81 /DNA_END=1136 /DNA_ORIENTATION=-
MTMLRIGPRTRSRSKLRSTNSKIPNGSREEMDGDRRNPNGGAGSINKVAIVGAGFAGLVLANYLELHLKKYREPQQNEESTSVDPKNRQWEYKLFEAKSSSGIPVIGTISLESARQVLEEIALFDEACSEAKGKGTLFPKIEHNKNQSSAITKDNDDLYKEVSREAFLQVLRKNVKIESSSRVVDIVPSKKLNDLPGPKYFVVIEGEERKRSKYGPFDLVVAANGLSFRGDASKALQKTLKASTSIVKIGDSRYRYGRHWWDFDFLGFTRRTSGADTAIRDGLQVGKRLIGGRGYQGAEGRGQPCISGVQEGVVNSHISSTSFQHENLGKLAKIFIAILLPIILAIHLYY